LAAGTVLRRTFERSSDFLRVGQGEDAALEVERIAFAGHALRPAFRFGRRLFRRGPPAGGAASGLSRSLSTLRHLRTPSVTKRKRRQIRSVTRPPYRNPRRARTLFPRQPSRLSRIQI